MELILAFAAAGPMGYFSRSPRSGLLIYVGAWAALLPIQTIVVHNENPDDIGWQYAAVNALIFAVGLSLNRFGARRRAR